MITETLVTTAAAGTVLCGLLNVDVDCLLRKMDQFENLKCGTCSSDLKDFVEPFDSTSVYSDNTDSTSLSSTMSDYASSSPEEKSHAYSERSSFQQIDCQTTKSEKELDRSSCKDVQCTSVIEHRDLQISEPSVIEHSGDKLDHTKKMDGNPSGELQNSTQEVPVSIKQKSGEQQCHRIIGEEEKLEKAVPVPSSQGEMQNSISADNAEQEISKQQSKEKKNSFCENVEVDIEGVLPEMTQIHSVKPRSQESGDKNHGEVTNNGESIKQEKSQKSEIIHQSALEATKDMCMSPSKGSVSKSNHLQEDAETESVKPATAEDKSLTAESKEDVTNGFVSNKSCISAKESRSDRSLNSKENKNETPGLVSSTRLNEYGKSGLVCSQNTKENQSQCNDPESVCKVAKDTSVDEIPQKNPALPSKQVSKYALLLTKLSSASQRETDDAVKNNLPKQIQTKYKFENGEEKHQETQLQINSFSDVSTLSESLQSANSFDSETLIPPPICDSRRVKRFSRPLQRDRVGLFRKLQKPWS